PQDLPGQPLAITPQDLPGPRLLMSPQDLPGQRSPRLPRSTLRLAPRSASLHAPPRSTLRLAPTLRLVPTLRLAPMLRVGMHRLYGSGISICVPTRSMGTRMHSGSARATPGLTASGSA